MLHARVRPEKPAVILPDRIVTYDMMAQGVLRVEEQLRSLRLEPGALVGIAVENPVRHLILAAALFRLGHPSLSTWRISDVLPLELPVAVFLHATNETIHFGQRLVSVDDNWFQGDRRPFPTGPSRAFSNDDAICRIELSSGTTGLPKAISLSVDALHQWILNYYAAIGLGLWDRLLCLPGLNSSWGFSLAAHTVFAGKTLLFAATPRDALQTITVYGVDALAASTQQLRELVREQAEAPLPCASLRVILTGGSLVPRTLMVEAAARICSSVVNLYGSTEVGATAFATVDQLTAEGATGFVAPWAEVEIVNEADHPQPPGIEGDLRIRSSCQGRPFPSDRPDQHAVFRGGWFYPGDRGCMTPNGLLMLTGRNSDVINAGGVKLAPATIERTVLQHSAVIEAVAFGEANADGVEQVAVAIVTRHPVSDSAIITWCQERGIPLSRVVTVKSLPLNASGKVNVDQLRRSIR
jgi:acyl-coenzyme A synthetase/AMP-(fatty) acid ligase